MELQGAARENIKVTVVVIAAGESTMERLNELARWGRTIKTAMGDVRWDQVAKGLGCHGEYVESMSDPGLACCAPGLHLPRHWSACAPTAMPMPTFRPRSPTASGKSAWESGD
jgi:hypothetical protein